MAIDISFYLRGPILLPRSNDTLCEVMRADTGENVALLLHLHGDPRGWIATDSELNRGALGKFGSSLFQRAKSTAQREWPDGHDMMRSMQLQCPEFIIFTSRDRMEGIVPVDRESPS